MFKVMDYKKMSKKFLLLLLSFFVLNILDLITTWTFLELGWFEGNPFWSHFNTIGIGWFDVVLKIGGGVAVCFLGCIMYVAVIHIKEMHRLRMIMICLVGGFWVGINIFYLYVVMQNSVLCLTLMGIL